MSFWVGVVVGSAGTAIGTWVARVIIENMAFRRFWGP